MVIVWVSTTLRWLVPTEKVTPRNIFQQSGLHIPRLASYPEKRPELDRTCDTDLADDTGKDTLRHEVRSRALGVYPRIRERATHYPGV
jgi:hypothetical protein